MSAVEDKARTRLAWALSVLLHALFFLLVFPGRSPAGIPGIRVLEVGLVELKEEATGSSPAASSPAVVSVSPPSPTEVALPGPRSLPRETVAPAREEKTSAQVAPTGGTPVPSVVPGQSESSPGTAGEPSGPRFDFGSGEGLVITHPLSYPKSAQNEGVEGAVRLAVLLSPTGRPQAELIASSGDGRLDSYALRAVTEVWRYERPPVSVRLEIELIFTRGEVRVDFLGTTPQVEEGGP
ncbi:MAG: TonB family protein [Firmicutes bacterium]|nr:TonB family protein [Bacillota bacterium]